MATTLQTGDFSLRALPRVPQLNPADFDAQLGQLLSLYGATMEMPARLEQVRATQRAGEIGRATHPQNLELAKGQAAANVELLPFETAAKKRTAQKVLTEPGGQNLTYDEFGNLVREDVVVETDPITGEQFNVSVPNIVKTAAQVADERTAAAALAQSRVAAGEAATTRAQAATTAAEAAKMRAENDKLKIENAIANKRSFRMFKNTGFGGKTVGFVATVFDPITGEFINQELDASGKPVGEPFRSKAEPQGELVTDTTPQQPAAGTGTIKFNPSAEDPAPPAPASGTVQPFLGPSGAQSLAPPAPVAPVASEPPVMTPEQVRAAPSGTRYRTTDGRTGVKP